MASKEDLIHDINIVTTLSSRQDMSVPSNAHKYLNYYVQNKVFKTGVGQHYIERLKQISAGSKPETCFVCKKDKSYDGILCEACMQKYTRGTKQFYKEPEQDVFADLDEIFADDQQGTGIASDTFGTINNAGPGNLSPVYNSSVAPGSDKTKDRKKPSVKSIIAFIVLFFLVSGLLGVVGTFAHDFFIKPQSGNISETKKTSNGNGSNSSSGIASSGDALNFAKKDITIEQFNNSLMNNEKKVRGYENLNLSKGSLRNGYTVKLNNTHIVDLVFSTKSDNSPQNPITGLWVYILDPEDASFAVPLIQTMFGCDSDTAKELMLRILKNIGETVYDAGLYFWGGTDSMGGGSHLSIFIDVEDPEKKTDNYGSKDNSSGVSHTGKEAPVFTDNSGNSRGTQGNDASGLNRYAYTDEELKKLLENSSPGR